MSVIKRFIHKRAQAYTQINICPQVQDILLMDGYFKFESSIRLDYEGSPKDLVYRQITDLLSEADINIHNEANHRIVFQIKAMERECYELEILAHTIRISAADNIGFLYALYSQRQIWPPDLSQLKGSQIPLLIIKDFPKFSWRSFSLDCSRQFFPIETLEKLFDFLAFYKINIFHWHLCDDEGWRLELDCWPDLTLKGAWRGPNEILLPDRGSGQHRYGGFYTKNEIRELIGYAQDRGIEIIPEIDIPGHSLAILNSYPETRCDNISQALLDKGVKLNSLCPSRPQNLNFIEEILKEIASLFPSDYIHIGNDEVERAHWNNCPSCLAAMKDNGFESSRQLQDLFFRKVHKAVESLGKKVLAWNESLQDPLLPQSTTIMSWEGIEPAKEAVKRDIPVILCPGEFCYIDMAQGAFERGHSWAGFLDMEKVYSYEPLEGIDRPDLIKGYGICLWAEYLDKKDFIWEQIFPRLLAASEVAWSHPKSWGGLFNRYKNFHCQFLKDQEIPSRLNKPKLVYRDSIVQVIKAHPKDIVYYTTDGSQPNEDNSIYERPTQVAIPSLFKARLLSPCMSWSDVSSVPNFDFIQKKQYSHYPYELITYRKARWQEPESNAGKGNRDLYVWVPTPYMPGEFIDFKFKNTLQAECLEIRTGVPQTLRSLVEEADLLYSFDGLHFQKLTEFKHGTAVAQIKFFKIKFLRILFNKEQSEWTAIQELLIKA
ncbi:family 20 glycosylhydrolase [Lentisphaera profundi]|uniref:beta-N-acetylhexosaminidase n=1 Tax=Lentisphaera profundi TaxID=1658616 RepID=A0ABY7VTK1_9BACT|nr:family 20 glycosylhydrolase [Lentisphaera profundi]WDE97500.1 family 20 glycosylhydrolase [Lentisphaera profundi]